MKLQWTKRNTTRLICLLAAVAFGVLLYFLLDNWGKAEKLIQSVFEILRPFMLGFAVAYLLNSPLNFFEEKVFSHIGALAKQKKIRRVLAIIVTWLVTIGVLTFFFAMVIPQVVDSVQMLIKNIPGYIDGINSVIDELSTRFGFDRSGLDERISSYLSVDGLISKASSLAESILPELYSFGVRLGGGIIDVFMGMVISVYLMFNKETLISQLKKALYAMLSKGKTETLVATAKESHFIFSSFISGKLLDSLVIGILCFIGMSLFGMPYSLLISFIVGVTNVIPFFGPLFGAIPSTLILLIIDPWKAFWFVVFVLALQQFDGNILGPKILGESTGLPAIWVMFAILVGGGLFGVAGMFLGVPAFAVIYRLTRRFFHKKLGEKGLPICTSAYSAEGVITENEDKAEE